MTQEINVTEILDVESDDLNNCPVMEAVYNLIFAIQNNPEIDDSRYESACSAVRYLEIFVNEKESKILEERKIEQASDGAAIDRAMDNAQ